MLMETAIERGIDFFPSEAVSVLTQNDKVVNRAQIGSEAEGALSLFHSSK
jgi:hypothetical protein